MFRFCEFTMAERSLLLTGATGFVGGAVRPALAAQNGGDTDYNIV